MNAHVRWLEGNAALRWIGDPTVTDQIAARVSLLTWSKSDGAASSPIPDYGSNMLDLPPAWTGWGYRDGVELRAFRDWWNGSGYTPQATVNTGSGAVGVTYPTDADVAALQAWSMKHLPNAPAGWQAPPKGVPSQAPSLTCATGCEAKYGITSGKLDALQLANCLAACGQAGGGGGGGGGGAGPCGPQNPCPAGYECVAGSCKGTGSQAPLCPPEKPYWDSTNQACQPAPSGVSTTAPSGVSSTTGMLVIGAVVLAAVGILAATVGAAGGATAAGALKRNPLKRDAEWVREHWEKNRSGYYLLVYDSPDRDRNKRILAKTKSAATAANLIHQGFLSIGTTVHPYAKRLEDFTTY